MNGDNQMPGSGGGKGSLIGSIIVVLILIAGAIYLFSQKSSAPVIPETNNPEGGTPALNAPENNPPTTEATVTQESLDLDAAAASSDADSLDQDLKALNQDAGL